MNFDFDALAASARQCTPELAAGRPMSDSSGRPETCLCAFCRVRRMLAGTAADPAAQRADDLAQEVKAFRSSRREADITAMSEGEAMNAVFAMLRVRLAVHVSNMIALKMDASEMVQTDYDEDGGLIVGRHWPGVQIDILDEAKLTTLEAEFVKQVGEFLLARPLMEMMHDIIKSQLAEMGRVKG